MMAIAETEKRRSRGRPRTNSTPINLKLRPDELATLDAWIESQQNPPTRPEAIRRILRWALKGVPVD